MKVYYKAKASLTSRNPRGKVELSSSRHQRTRPRTGTEAARFADRRRDFMVFQMPRPVGQFCRPSSSAPPGSAVTIVAISLFFATPSTPTQPCHAAVSAGGGGVGRAMRLRGGNGVAVLADANPASRVRRVPLEAGVADRALESLKGGAGEGTLEMRKGLEGLDEVEDDGNQTSTVCNTDGGCPHGRHSDNPDEQHCMECEVMAFLQRAANLLQQAGGRIESTIFAEQWTQLYPDDPLTVEQVATAVAGILKESGYFHVEETSDPSVKLFELIEQADDGAGIGDCPQTICLPFELSPPEQDDFLDAARAWLSTTGIGRHPAVGSGRITHDELAERIAKAPEKDGKPRQRHDEVQYTGKWGEQLVGYWTLGACDGSNGCIHAQKNIGMQHHWTCCGSTDMNTVFCESQESVDDPDTPIPELP